MQVLTFQTLDLTKKYPEVVSLLKKPKQTPKQNSKCLV